MNAEFREALGSRILVLDGAMGTVLQSRGLKGNSEEFCLTRPDEILRIHSEYISAGADIIATCSFGANRISQSEYGLSDKASQMAETAARLARKAADGAGRKVWVAGSIGPTGKSLSLAQNISDPVYRPYSFDRMAEAYKEQIEAMTRGGVDLILFETCFDALNTKAGLYALSQIPEAQGLEIMISASLSDKSGRLLTGQTVEAFYRSVEHAAPVSFGLNCSLGAKDLEPMVSEISRWASAAVSCYPNAGLPDEMGEYNESPAETAEAIRHMASEGLLNIAGGCCGTTPSHIRAIAEAVRDLSPRNIPAKDNVLHVSGLEAVAVDKDRTNFTNVGERTNVSGSRKFAKLIEAGDYETALQVAAGQVESGASIIDINVDDAMLDSAAEMEKFLRYVSNDPAVAKAAIMIDSSHWETLETGLKNAQGKCIVNSISLKEGEEAFLRKAKTIKALGAAVVVIAFDEVGQATTYGRKIEICRRAYSLLTKEAGFDPRDIIFDVNVLPVGTGIPEHARYGIDFIEAVRWIKQNLPGTRTSGGISNLSFSFRGNNAVREAMHSVFLYHAIAAGLDMGIVNPAMLKVYDEIEPELLRCCEDVILDSDPGATERLIDKAARTMAETEALKSGAAAPKTADRSAMNVEERLSQALVKGESSILEDDLQEALVKFGKAVDVIEGPLMDGMAKVGQLFGDGKMFLPQVVKSAKIMKSAVALLQPVMEAESGDSSVRKPRVLMATVKGDVHDIGKNITSIVLNCNGFEVKDLGVMVPKEEILQKAEEFGADVIGVSGLITPSLFQMEELCREMNSRGLNTPLMVGGAATSAIHTAVKLAPLYGHVFYGSDASYTAVLASRLVSDREATEKSEHEAQERLREMYAKGPKKSGETATLKPFAEDTFLKGKGPEDIEARELSVAEVLPFFDWSLFSAIWGLKADAPEEEAAKLKSDAEDALRRLRISGGCRITLSARFDAAHSEGDDIVAKGFRLPMFRQNGGRSLADFVAPEAYGFGSSMGMFAISVHGKHKGAVCDCSGCEMDYDRMVERAVRLTLAEAASNWLDDWIRRNIPEGFKVIKPAAGYSSCPDHTLKRDILELLPEAGKLGITLLDSCAMIPDASICGLIFMHPEASYPEIRRAGRKAIDEYARRRGFSDAEKAQFLGHLL